VIILQTGKLRNWVRLQAVEVGCLSTSTSQSVVGTTQSLIERGLGPLFAAGNGPEQEAEYVPGLRICVCCSCAWLDTRSTLPYVVHLQASMGG